MNRVKYLMIILVLFLSGCMVTPKPLTDSELDSAANRQRASVTADQEPVTAPIGLYEAMARALKYNLDHRVEKMQIALAHAKVRSANADLLPELAANGYYSGRSNYDASESESILTGLRTRRFTTSNEKQGFVGDLTFTWHVLDFGLSYVRAKQSADDALVTEQLRRKVVHRITEDVRTTYWRAISAERLLSGFRKLEGRVASAQSNTRKLARSGETSPLEALTFERELIDIKKQISRLERELSDARHALAALMNLPPDQKFRLEIPKRSLSDLKVRASGEELIETALRNRPEFHELLYKGRINKRQEKVVLLETLPGPSIYAGLNVDTNDFLYNSNWAAWGARASWNVIKVIQYPTRRKLVQSEGELIDAQARALTMAIMTQVHVARARYHYLRKSAYTAAEYYRVQRKIRDQVRAGVAAETDSEQTLIREQMNTLVAAVEYDIAYAQLQNAFAAIYTSVGLDPLDVVVSSDISIKELSGLLKKTWRERGDLSGG